ncbi:MAG: Holliday junction resolvase RuvX [Zoogloeaceae bacterium]|jgi:putative Holliday junction resolvase|nr:Holliday junction resolvase RuvX [Zoogloeaceae bacterium]
MGTVLAFDFGKKRTGVAIGETTLKQSHPLTVIITSDNSRRLAIIDQLIREWRPEHLVVGLPTHADGTSHGMTTEAHAFANTLKTRFQLPVTETDERLTSRDAETRLRETGHNARTAKSFIDAVAAQLILQTWFDIFHDDIPSLPA